MYLVDEEVRDLLDSQAAEIERLREAVKIIDDGTVEDLVAKLGEAELKLVHLRKKYDAKKVKVARLKEALRWRKWPDERPENSQSCFIFLPNGGIDVFYYDGGVWHCGKDVYTDATSFNWLPIPSCPQRQEGQAGGEEK
jgi:hypothetical protein